MIRRGDLVLVSLPGDYGKPRPAVVVQTDGLNQTHASILVCLMTSTLVDAPAFRVRINPGGATGLRLISDIMVDKIHPAPRERLLEPIGHASAETMAEVDAALMTVLGIGD